MVEISKLSMLARCCALLCCSGWCFIQCSHLGSMQQRPVLVEDVLGCALKPITRGPDMIRVGLEP